MSPVNIRKSPPVELVSIDARQDAATDATERVGEDELQDVSLGEILRRAGKLSPEGLTAILQFQQQQKHPVRFGDAAVELGHATREDVLWALSQQFHYPHLDGTGRARFHQELVVATRPFGDEVEAFRDLRSHVLMTVMAPGQAKRALAVVSADVGDGKTFTAANLAVAFSQLPGRTLLVDCDMRSPRIQDLFGLQGSAGLSSVLSGRAETDFIRPMKALPNLYLLPVGAIPPNPTELLLRNTFPMLMRELIERFDYVIVDTPAAVYGSDAKSIAARCGAALAVARRNKTNAHHVQTFMQQLQKADVVMAGVVMNDG